MKYSNDQKMAIVKMAMVYKGALNPYTLRRAGGIADRASRKLWDKVDTRKVVPFLFNKKRTNTIEALARKRGGQATKFRLGAMDRANKSLFDSPTSVIMSKLRM